MGWAVLPWISCWCRAERETSLLLALSGLDLLIVLSVRCPGLQVAE